MVLSFRAERPMGRRRRPLYHTHTERAPDGRSSLHKIDHFHKVVGHRFDVPDRVTVTFTVVIESSDALLLFKYGRGEEILNPVHQRATN
jgi:hypothetical protein